MTWLWRRHDTWGHHECVGAIRPGCFGLSWRGESYCPAGAGVSFLLFLARRARMHVHVYHAKGEAKFWREPTVELFASYGLSASRVNEASKLIEEHLDEIRSAWVKHFSG